MQTNALLDNSQRVSRIEIIPLYSCDQWGHDKLEKYFCFDDSTYPKLVCFCSAINQESTNYLGQPAAAYLLPGLTQLPHPLRDSEVGWSTIKTSFIWSTRFAAGAEISVAGEKLKWIMCLCIRWKHQSMFEVFSVIFFKISKGDTVPLFGQLFRTSLVVWHFFVSLHTTTPLSVMLYMQPHYLLKSHCSFAKITYPTFLHQIKFRGFFLVLKMSNIRLLFKWLLWGQCLLRCAQVTCCNAYHLLLGGVYVCSLSQPKTTWNFLHFTKPYSP